ncbi:MAG TPA: hypothetical protein VFB72_18305 [Verrucomicrobiae bacterium]|nr:hypothetical protein [Verrucomicrobiae bacterium]
MPEATPIRLVEQRLVELACPPAILQRKIRELAEHREDLKREALEEGLSEDEAEERADKLLGEPYALAEHLAAALRQSSWWGRHPIIGFCLLPPFIILLCLFLGLWLGDMITRLILTPDQLNALADDSAGLAFFRLVLQGIYYCAIVVAAALFCWLARRTMTGLKWALAASGICALHGWLFWVQVRPHNISAGYNYPPRGAGHWAAILVPLAVVLFFWWRKKRFMARLGLGKVRWKELRKKYRNAVKNGAAQKLAMPKKRFLTPTTIIATILLLAIVSLVWLAKKADAEDAARTAELHEKIWPAERAQVMEQIKARQSVKETKGETTIDLRSKVTIPLGKTNSLAELPSGIHIFGGVPFDVEGSVQLWGRGFADPDKKYPDSGRKFPERARGIAIRRKCARIYMLHSVGFVKDEMRGQTVAQLVLHYADGSQEILNIKIGEQVQGWWGPIYKTDADPGLCETTAPGTELAWVGTTPSMQERSPESSLRLYKSTFDNPHPDRELLSIDYVSTLTNAAPFMVGMTVE